jgi:hypothetical protein
MSTETHVFFRGKLPTKTALSRAMKELGFPFSIKPATGSLEQQSGFMPMLLRREETGVEFDVYNDHAAVEEFTDEGVDQSFERRASFRWSGDFQEAVAGMCAAAALAKLVNGVVFDEAENKLLPVDDAIELARRNLDELPRPKRQGRPRGPTVLKRMLAPLLAKRSDLVLVNALLIIRPVRHLIRGADFRWHSGGTVCSVCPYIRPLYQSSEVFLEDAVLSAGVDSPDFEAMLFDRLAVEIFEPLGQIATIEDFIASSWGQRLWAIDLYASITLSRGVSEAKAYIAKFDVSRKESLGSAKERLAVADRKNKELIYHRKEELKRAEEPMTEAKDRQAFLARGDAAVFAHYHDWEGKVARGYKIEEAWEPSPFPAELPAAQRTAKSTDPTLTPAPWLDFPDTWRQAPPETPGEVRFGRDWWERQGRVTLLHPIAREQAEVHHRNFENYTLMTRLSGGQLLILSHSGSPKEGKWMPPVRYVLRIYDAQGDYMIVDFQEHFDDLGILRMRSIDIKRARGWYSFLDFEDGEKSIHDSRMEEKSYERRPMTKADRSAYAFPPPRFGEFDSLWQRISMYIDREGFGTFM